MPDVKPCSERIRWIKQRRDEIDFLTSSLIHSAVVLQDEARIKANRAIAELYAVRYALAQRLDVVAAKARCIGDVADGTMIDLSIEWAKVDVALESFTAAASGHCQVVEAARTAKADAQERFRRASLEQI